MSVRITHFYHYESDTTSRASIGTTYDKTKGHSYNLLANRPQFQQNVNWRGRLEGLNIQVNTIAGGAASLTMRICSDADGDVVLVPDTTATISTGITTATSGSVAFKVDVPLQLPVGGPGAGTLYLFVKVDVGTVTMGSSQLSWSE